MASNTFQRDSNVKARVSKDVENRFFSQVVGFEPNGVRIDTTLHDVVSQSQNDPCVARKPILDCASQVHAMEMARVPRVGPARVPKEETIRVTKADAFKHDRVDLIYSANVADSNHRYIAAQNDGSVDPKHVAARVSFEDSDVIDDGRGLSMHEEVPTLHGVHNEYSVSLPVAAKVSSQLTGDEERCLDFEEWSKFSVCFKMCWD